VVSCEDSGPSPGVDGLRAVVGVKEMSGSERT